MAREKGREREREREREEEKELSRVASCRESAPCAGHGNEWCASQLVKGLDEALKPTPHID